MIHRNQIAPEMNKDIININNELSHCEARLSAIKLVANVTMVDTQPVIGDHKDSKETPPEVMASSDVASSSQPSLVEYKEVISCLEKSNVELATVNEQVTLKVVNLENEKTSLMEELQRLQAEMQELREGTMSAVGEDLQMQDGAGESMKISEDIGEKEQNDDKKGEENNEESDHDREQEAEVTSAQESVTDKEQVQSRIDLIF